MKMEWQENKNIETWLFTFNRANMMHQWIAAVEEMKAGTINKDPTFTANNNVNNNNINNANQPNNNVQQPPNQSQPPSNTNVKPTTQPANQPLQPNQKPNQPVQQSQPAN